VVERLRERVYAGKDFCGEFALAIIATTCEQNESFPAPLYAMFAEGRASCRVQIQVLLLDLRGNDTDGNIRKQRRQYWVI